MDMKSRKQDIGTTSVQSGMEAAAEGSLYLGCHLSIADGWLAMGRQALEIGASTFQFFSRNPRGSSVRRLDAADVAALKALLEAHRFGPLVAHAPYTYNPCSANPQAREFARTAMAEDLARLEMLPGQLYNLHPGSHVGQGAEKGIRLTAEVLDETMASGPSTVVLLETMAGKGSEIGRNFGELRAILDRCAFRDRIGVCLDTCHVSDAGYDLIGDLDGVLREFDRVVGIDRLRAIHLNDSMNPPGSAKDRHARIGEGSLGLETFRHVVRHPLLRNLPFCLETPNELDGYAKEIRLLRELAEVDGVNA